MWPERAGAPLRSQIRPEIECGRCGRQIAASGAASRYVALDDLAYCVQLDTSGFPQLAVASGRR